MVEVQGASEDAMVMVEGARMVTEGQGGCEEARVVKEGSEWWRKAKVGGAGGAIQVCPCLPAGEAWQAGLQRSHLISALQGRWGSGTSVHGQGAHWERCGWPWS